MRIWAFFLHFLLCLPFSSMGVDPIPAKQDSAVLRVKVSNIEENKGEVFVWIFNSEQSYMKQEYAKKVVPVKSVNDLIAEIKLPIGRYAISVYHDVNGDGELTTNFFGIPKEPYGFSNNPKTTIGPAKYDQAVFDFEHDRQEIAIILK